MNNISQYKENEDYNNLMNDLLDENNILKKENEKLINDLNNNNELKEKYDKLNIDFNKLKEENESNNLKYYNFK